MFNKTVQKKSIETKIIRLFHHVPKTKNEWINRLIQRAVKLYILASQLNILHTLLLKFKWLEWVGIVTTLDQRFRFCKRETILIYSSFTQPFYLMIFELIDIIQWNSSKRPLSNKIQGNTPTLSSQSYTTTVTQKNDVIFSLKKNQECLSLLSQSQTQFKGSLTKMFA